MAAWNSEFALADSARAGCGGCGDDNGVLGICRGDNNGVLGARQDVDGGLDRAWNSEIAVADSVVSGLP